MSIFSALVTRIFPPEPAESSTKAGPVPAGQAAGAVPTHYGFAQLEARLEGRHPMGPPDSAPPARRADGARRDGTEKIVALILAIGAEDMVATVGEASPTATASDIAITPERQAAHPARD